MQTDLPRVLFVDHTSERGGAELALLRLLETSRDWSPALMVPPAADADADVFDPLPEHVRAYRVGPHQAARRATATGPAAGIRLAYRIVRSAIALASSPAIRSCDIVVANTTRASVYVALAGFIARKPIALHIRDMIEPSSIGALATRVMRRFVLPRARAVIANSRTTLSHVAPYISTQSLSAVIPSPSGLDKRTPDDLAPISEVRSIGMVARLDPWKGQEMLLRAFARLSRVDEMELVFYGAPAFGHQDYEKALRDLSVQLGVAKRVVFRGHVDDVSAAIQQIDVCVQCSLRPEPLGQNVLQYLANGKPTIVANEGGPAEWVRHDVNGVTFTAGDEDSLVSVLERVVSDERLRSRLARAAVTTPGLASDEEISREIMSLLANAATISWAKKKRTNKALNPHGASPTT